MRKSGKKLSDGEIVDLLFARDEQAIVRLDEKYGGLVTTVCRRVLRDRGLCADCKTDVFLALWNKIPPERPENLGAYLAGIARGMAIDRYRALMRKKRIRSDMIDALDDLDDLFSDDLSPADEAEARELGETLNRFLSERPERERRLFVRRYYLCEPLERVAEDLGIPRRTAYAILSKMKEALKERLTKEGYFV